MLVKGIDPFSTQVSQVSAWLQRLVPEMYRVRVFRDGQTLLTRTREFRHNALGSTYLPSTQLPSTEHHRKNTIQLLRE